MKDSVLIVGFGNVLAGDDAAGIAVIECLRAVGVPRGVRTEIGGTDSLCLADLWDGEREIWITDAVAGGGPAGTVHRLDHEQLLRVPQKHASAHHLGLAENLRWLSLARPDMREVRFRLWGIEPGELREPGRLSPPVARAVAPLADRIRNEALARVVQ